MFPINETVLIVIHVFHMVYGQSVIKNWTIITLITEVVLKSKELFTIEQLEAYSIIILDMTVYTYK